MEYIGIFDAKTKFSELVDRVVREGRPVTVTRRGVPVVDIVPTREKLSGRMTREQAVAELSKLRRELPKMGPQEIVDLVAEGRR